MNELDRCSKDARDMLRTHLDRMRPGHAFLGTTNLNVVSLTERFQTRFQSVRLQPTENEALAAFPAWRWGTPIPIHPPDCGRSQRQGGAGELGDVDGVKWLHEPVAGPVDGAMGVAGENGLARRNNRNNGADQGVGPAESRMKIDFIPVRGCGGIPRQTLINEALPARSDKELAEGVWQALRKGRQVCDAGRNAGRTRDQFMTPG
ncbi:MAG: hypothetical protein NTW21_28190 [Verrucomicrobia bacterium]|nr:hypothetical protein [Verrucomicrobiota bacterium]